MESTRIVWSCEKTWKQSAKNTAWCLLGCSIGDFGTILFFQITKISFPILSIMILAIINGLITSIILETFILMRQKINFGNGTLWKYAQTVGPAYLGAPTHPGAKEEVRVYADI